MRLRPRRCFSAFLLAICFANELSAQTTTSGAVTGVVTDQSGAVVPNADVEIRDVNKGTTESTEQIATACTVSSFFLPANTR